MNIKIKFYLIFNCCQLYSSDNLHYDQVQQINRDETVSKIDAKKQQQQAELMKKNLIKNQINIMFKNYLKQMKIAIIQYIKTNKKFFITNIFIFLIVIILIIGYHFKDSSYIKSIFLQKL